MPGVICAGAQETERLGERIGRTLQGGEVFALEGELGSGKTTFVKGLARGLGFSGTVTSPTFNLVHRYDGGRAFLLHFDLYRLQTADELETLDLDGALESGAVVAIEWPERARATLPERTRWVRFADAGNARRRIAIGENVPPSAPGDGAGEGSPASQAASK